MKISLVTTHLNIGGIPRYTVDLANTLFNRGNEVMVVSSGGSLCHELSKGIVHKEIDLFTKSELHPKVLKSVGHLSSLFKKERPDIIHAQTRVTQVSAYFASKASDIPFVSTCHGFFKPRFFRKAFGFWGKLVIAISEPVKQYLIEKMRVSPDRVRLIHNGINAERFSSACSLQEQDKINFKTSINLKSGPVVGIVARLSEVKGHSLLIRAFRQVLRIISDAQLLIVGEGKERTRLLNLVDALGITKNVYFLPSVLDTSKILAAMDVFCLPSLEEGLGLALLEAQACGLPIVASRVGGISSVIEDRVTGLLFKTKDHDELASKLILLLQDKELAHRLGENAQNFVKERFSLEQMVKCTEEVYKEAVHMLDH